MGQLHLNPQCVIDAVCNYYTYLGANAHRGDYQMSAQVDEAFENARNHSSKDSLMPNIKKKSLLHQVLRWD